MDDRRGAIFWEAANKFEMNKEYIKSLDGVRGFAALLVLYGHSAGVLGGSWLHFLPILRGLVIQKRSTEDTLGANDRHVCKMKILGSLADTILKYSGMGE